MYHRESIELWFKGELFPFTDHDPTNHDDEAILHFLASATLVDFPQFRDIHILIPQIIMDWPAEKFDYRQIEDSDKWETYVKYRQIVSRFLIGQTCCGIPPDTENLSFFSAWSRRGQGNYVNLAKYLLKFLSGDL